MKLHGSIIVTYRCNARCNMCDVWRYPTKKGEEIGLEVIRKLPRMFFTNVTGGEPFVRTDLPEIIAELFKRTRRIVISTNGFFTKRIVSLCRQYPQLGIRISLEGMESANDLIRGMPGQYARTQQTLQQLRQMGMKDIGVAMTIQDHNYQDLTAVHDIARRHGYEFATAAVHNSHYFRKQDNRIDKQLEVNDALLSLIARQLRSSHFKEWFRAYFNYGLINFIRGNRRLLPCEMGKNGFFLDPFGDVLACNGMTEKMPMGNLKEKKWEEIWRGAQARRVRSAVKHCGKNCWMIGSAAPAIWHHPLRPALWVMKEKIGMLVHP